MICSAEPRIISCLPTRNKFSNKWQLIRDYICSTPNFNFMTCKHINSQVFNVETMRLMMGDAKRPSQMVVYKSTTSDASAGYRPWVYRVTAVSECQTKFSQPYGDMPTSSTGSTCTRYTNPMATGLETVRAYWGGRSLAFVSLFYYYLNIYYYLIV